MNERPFDAIIATPLPAGWRVAVRCEAGRLTEVEFLPADRDLVAPKGPARAVADWLDDYFRDPRTEPFELPMTAAKTPFQAKIRRALCAIPVGETTTYGQIAKRLQSSPRAVAGGCRNNPLPLVVPCHRVVGAAGPGGFMGALDGPPLALKAWLLAHEAF